MNPLSCRSKHIFNPLPVVLFCTVFLLLPVLLFARLTDTDMVSFIPSARQQVKLFWKDDNNQVLGSLGRLNQYVASKKQNLVFAMNGGMYMEDRAPLGLFIKEGKTLRQLNRATGYGNFYLMPNGVFYITAKGKGVVCKTADFKAKGEIYYATQSGPMLVIDGKIHDAFKKGSSNVHIRNGIGILPDGRMLFAMSKKEVNLYDFAEYFKEKGCKNALFLDGFVCRTYYPAGNWKQTDGFFGVMIGVVE